MMLKKFLRVVNIPAYLLMVFIIFIMTKSFSGVDMSFFPHQDKIIHALIFFSFSFSLSLWVSFRRWEKYPLKYAFVVLLSSIAFGLFTEFIQSFIPSRSASVADLLADGLGSVIAIWIYIKLKFWRHVDAYYR